MNTRNYISFDKSEMNFTALPEENEQIFQRYMEFAPVSYTHLDYPHDIFILIFLMEH